MASLNTRINRLIDALDKIFLKESTELSFVEGYSECYSIVMQNYGDDLYQSIEKIISEHIRSRLQPLITKDLCNNRLDVMIKKWEDLDISARKFHDILLFLDLNYIQPKSLIEVYDMGLYNFRNMIIRDQIVSQSMQHVIYGMIIAERSGDTIDYPAIKTAVNLLIDIGESNNPYSEYDQIFEEKFLENSELFYKREAQALLQNNNAIKYIEKFETRLSEEKERVSRYLHKRTENKIIQLVENILIKENLNKIIELDFGLSWMFQENSLTELKKIYEYYKKYSKITEFHALAGQCFSVYANSIIDCVDNVIDINGKSKIIEDLLNLKSKFDNITKICFENNNDLKAIYDNMFTIAMSSKPKTSEYLASYIHSRMRKYKKAVSDTEIDKELDEFIELFKLVTEKDAFEKYAKAHLARRLLNRTANIDIENKFIGKLQLECGTDYIQKLQKMTKDIITNDTHMELFHNEMIAKNINLPEIDFSINVLCRTDWPSFQYLSNINLPEKMDKIYNIYLKFYNDKHTGRKIDLQYNLGNVEIKSCYEPFGKKKKRNYILDVSTLNAAILDVFTYTDTLSINEIQAKTNIVEKSLDILLNQLVQNKILILNEKNDGIIKLYSINLGFFSKNYKFKIKVNNVVENREENKKIEEKILNERSMVIEAAIVRVMKMRKRLNEVVLHSEVINVLNKRFKPSVNMLKIKIKDLIRREFIAYDNNDATTIIYLE